MEPVETDELRLEQKQHRLDAADPWYAACQSGHAFWAGPDRDIYQEAAADARNHDARRHDGEETAVVLN
jgi:hypothetical protein